MLKPLSIVVAVCIGCLISVAPAEVRMKSPPPDRAPDEVLLDPAIASKLSCIMRVRDIAADFDGIISQSEEVSRDVLFGYIFRYQMIREHIITGMSQPYKSRSVLVVWTADCSNLEFATYSMTDEKERS